MVSGLLLAGCATDVRKSGYYPLAQDLAVVEVGKSSRTDVVAQIGSPTIGNIESDSIFYYVGQKTRYFGPFEPRIVDRQVVAVSFDRNGRVANIVTYGLEDGNIVVINSRITEPVGGDLSALKQIFGSFGRINPASLVN